MLVDFKYTSGCCFYVLALNEIPLLDFVTGGESILNRYTAAELNLVLLKHELCKSCRHYHPHIGQDQQDANLTALILKLLQRVVQQNKLESDGSLYVVVFPQVQVSET